jgi:hypothetical protein
MEELGILLAQLGAIHRNCFEQLELVPKYYLSAQLN